MRKNRSRELPPIVVSVLTGLLLSSVAITQINKSVAHEQWDKAQAVLTTDENIATYKPPAEIIDADHTSLIASRDWDSEDADILLKLAMAEAESESVEGKALVMLVVLNRVWSDGFPETVEAVVFQPHQFSPVKEGGRYYTTEPDAGCYEALRMIEQGWDESEGALYFESCEGNSWHSDNLEYLYQVGNHKFYR